MFSARPTYSKESDLKDYQKKKYFEGLISQNKNIVNPNLKFDTPLNYKKKLDEYIGNVLVRSPKDLKISKRPLTSYSKIQ